MREAWECVVLPAWKALDANEGPRAGESPRAESPDRDTNAYSKGSALRLGALTPTAPAASAAQRDPAAAQAKRRPPMTCVRNRSRGVPCRPHSPH